MITGDNLAKSPLFFNALVEGDDYKDELVRFSEQNYLVEKHSFILQNKEIGCCLILQNEKNLRDTEGQLNRQLKTRGLYAKYTFRDITCQSMSMKKSIDIAKRAALSDYTILIRGESGTGKELFAQSIHNYSLRKKAPFVAVNCAALPENLLESELFGYEPGAFTGAQKNGKIGLFEQAEKGTIFLDEIGDISPNLQSRLLRVIQEKQVMRIGSDKIIDINVRIIAATNANLEKQIACGKFRSDLFYRLNVLSIHIAPLRQCREDILPLLQNFLGKYYKDISPKERDILYRYDWPGNVRELENVAFYYRTLDTVPEYLQHPNQNQEQDQFQTSGLLVSTESVPEPTPVSRVPDSAPCSEEEIKKLILRLIADATKSLSGIGRTALLQKLALHNVQIGEGKLKRLLSECQNDGLIKVYQGRSGSQITPKGQAYLS
jgi:transcriptional regulator with PAS, ATPase and Fis domain